MFNLLQFTSHRCGNTTLVLKSETASSRSFSSNLVRGVPARASVSLGKDDQHQISLYILYLSSQVERDVLDHVAQIKAPSYLPTNDVQIPTGT